MNTLTKLSPKIVAERIKSGKAILIDIREADEHAREYIDGALSLPISTLDKGNLTLEAEKQAIFHCKSGMRTDSHCARLSEHIEGEGFMLEGGLEAWRTDGFPTVKDDRAPLEINRQVQITAGSLVLVGAALGPLIHPAFYALSAFIGAGLVFAGVSGWCGMGHLLAAMPWNNSAKAG